MVEKSDDSPGVDVIGGKLPDFVGSFFGGLYSKLKGARESFLHTGI